MSTMARLHLPILMLVCIFVPFRAHGEQRLVLHDGDVVIFAGGTNMVRMQRAGFLETMLTRAFAKKAIQFRDFSWEADTVFRQGSVIERWRKDGFGDRAAQLARLQATVVVAQFGRLESFAGAAGLPTFRKAYEHLIDALQKQAKRVVLLTPTPFEKPPNDEIPDLSKRNRDLALYVQAIVKIARDRELPVVDLFSNARPGLTENGMHIRPSAQRDIATRIVEQLRIPKQSAAIDFATLQRAVVEKHRLWYDYWRPANWKLLYGDDSRRVFTRGGKDYIPFRAEWGKLLPLIAKAEQRIRTVALGGKDPGHNRPRPEVLHADSRADIEKERLAFAVADGLKVNLFASEREGLTSPLAIRWDPAGRMYVTVTTTYPHVFPGDVPNDKIIMLEDTDSDGRADKSTVFAEGLNIPTGLEFGDGGVYVGQNTEILFLKDSDGDGKADQRRVVLSGFGNGDSHQTINSFIWSPGGELFLGQGDGIESRVETPWGASHLFQAGFYRFRPRRLQLQPLLNDFMGPGNPWGVAFDEWGQIFSIDGAGGVTYLSPGQIPTNHRLKLRRIGDPGGYCGIGYLDGRHLPKTLHGDFVVGDFKANRLKRFSLKESGAGFALQWKSPLLHSKHRNFRPVDVKVGPDGAIYVVDWYNPITCHQDDAYRDPTRDKAHGRIWRLSSSAATLKPLNFQSAPLDAVLKGLASPEHWTRYQAKRALTAREPKKVAVALNKWVRRLDPKQVRYEHHLYEALGAYATIEFVEPQLLRRLLNAQDARARAYAARIVGRWHDRLERPLELLAERVSDPHPRVRLEAVMACAAIPSARAMVIAAKLVDRPMDGWHQYAFKQTVHHLKRFWMPALQRGQLAFARPAHLAAVLNEAGGKDTLARLRKLAESTQLEPESRLTVIAAILAVGGPRDLRRYGLETVGASPSDRADPGFRAQVLSRLVEVARSRKTKPDRDLPTALIGLIDHDHRMLKTHGLTLAGLWQVSKTEPRVVAAAGDESLPISVRAAAFSALVKIDALRSEKLLTRYAVKPQATALRSAAIQALVRANPQSAATFAVELLASPKLAAADAEALLVAFLNRGGGGQALATQLASRSLSPALAKRLLAALFSTGRSDQELFVVLNRAIGQTARIPAFSESYVSQLVAEALAKGNAKRGAVLFRSSSCISCHKLSGRGGEIGPDLSAIGTTLAPNRIVEELLWPNRQVKEGFVVVQVLTDKGKLLQGYQRKTKASQESGDLIIEDLRTRKRITIKQRNIEQRKVVGSPMPTGLTAVLSRRQLLDLVRFVVELGRFR